MKLLEVERVEGQPAGGGLRIRFPLGIVACSGSEIAQAVFDGGLESL